MSQLLLFNIFIIFLSISQVCKLQYKPQILLHKCQLIWPKFIIIQMLSSLATRNRGPHLNKCPSVPLVTNLFKVDFQEEAKVYLYAARTEPNIAFDNNKKLRAMLINSRKIIERLIGTYVHTGRMVFGTKGQYCSIGEDVTFNIEFEGQTYSIFLKLVKAIVLKDLHCADKRRSGIVFGFLNSMLKNFFHQIGYSQIGRTGKYFNAKNMVTIDSAKVYIYKGYSSNFSLLEAGLFLRLDAAVKVVRNQTALQVINSVYANYPSLARHEKRKMVEMELIGKMVMANYGKGTYYIIEEVVYDTPIDKYFFVHNNTEINLVDYYQKTYGISISLKQPLLKAATNRISKLKKVTPIILVPQLMLMGGLPDKFDQRKRRQISSQTIVPPAQRFGQIASAFNSFNDNQSDFNPKVIADKLGIKFSSSPSKMDGKQLKIPELQLGKRDKIDERKCTSFILFDKQLFAPDIPLKMSIICEPRFDFSHSRQLLKSTCRKLGLQYEFIINEIRFGDPKITLRNIQQLIERQCGSEATPNMFWIIIPYTYKSHYGSIKKMVLEAGIEKNSQITVASTFQKKGFESVFTKILLQMAAKVGNKLWVPRVPTKVPQAGVMMIGLEKCKGSDSTIITYCSNSNRECSQFYSNYIVHNKEQDFKTHLNEIVFTCLSEYVRSNGQAPSDILLIKNGSTSHDNSTMISGQVAQVKDVLRAWQGPRRINFLYILLDKHTTQKFFIERGRDLVNPYSGLLVNTQAVGEEFEFYLVAQQATRGSLKPTFYRVVYSDSSLEEGIIEELLYGQCFNYMNWSGSIKVPAVMQYAKKLSIFIGQGLSQKTVGQTLSRHLYYI